MGMNFSPMYQPVSTKTIKSDGDLNINPYDLLATDVKCDTVEATEFVGGVGNFSKVIGSFIIPWEATTTNTGNILKSAQEGTVSGSASGWRTALTFSITIPNGPAIGLKYDDSVSSFYSTITFSNLIPTSGLTCQLRVNGVEYPIHDMAAASTFTDSDVLFNIGDNVIEFYSSVAVTRTYRYNIPTEYIKLLDS